MVVFATMDRQLSARLLDDIPRHCYGARNERMGDVRGKIPPTVFQKGLSGVSLLQSNRLLWPS